MPRSPSLEAYSSVIGKIIKGTLKKEILLGFPEWMKLRAVLVSKPYLIAMQESDLGKDQFNLIMLMDWVHRELIMLVIYNLLRRLLIFSSGKRIEYTPHPGLWAAGKISYFVKQVQISLPGDYFMLLLFEIVIDDFVE